MKTLNVLAAIVASAGLAASALGFTPNGTFTIEARLVLDGDPGAPAGPGITSFAPDVGATRIGLTLQARVTQTSSGSNVGSGNYGIGGLSASPEGAAAFALIDPATPSSSYVALKRGQTSSTTVTTAGQGTNPFRGFFGDQANPQDNTNASGNPATRNFRDLLSVAGGSAIANGEDTNPATAGILSPGANGLVSSSGIQGMASSIGALVNFAPNLYALGEVSPWYNLYRVYFDPNPNASSVPRFVTISFSGDILAVTNARYNASVNQTLLSIGHLIGDTSRQGRQTVSLSASVSVGQLPAPGAAALLGLGGLLAARRRRQR